MKVLVACEFSGVVRRAFRALGHDAWSCDLLPAEDGSEFHIQGDAFVAAYQRPQYWKDWDLMIAHPPCTYLANSGVRWLYVGGRGNVVDFERWQLMIDAAEFYKRLLDAPIDKIAIENPVMHKYAIEIVGPQSQFVQPWMFGHGEIKATGLRLKNLPHLIPTNIVDGRHARVHREPPSPDRWKNRSRTYEGIAKAMAQQWGGLR